jgi:DNA-binding MarR family transcriptional regulator
MENELGNPAHPNPFRSGSDASTKPSTILTVNWGNMRPAMTTSPHFGRNEARMPPALAGFTGFLLRRAHTLAEYCARATIPAPHRPRDLAILATLRARGPSSQQQLARLTHVNRTIMVKLVDSLEARGLVIRGRTPDDRRSYALTPTDRGMATLRALEIAAAESDAMLTANLGSADRATLDDLLRALLADRADQLADPLATSTGHLVTEAYLLVRERFEPALRPLGLHPRHFGALSVLATEQPCAQSHVAERLAVSAPVAFEIVDEMARAGLVRRTRNPDDRRAYALTLTGNGRARLAAAHAEAEGIDDDIAGRLGEDRKRELNRLLMKLLTPAAGGVTAEKR